jgi:hypothetical protein
MTCALFHIRRSTVRDNIEAARIYLGIIDSSPRWFPFHNKYHVAKAIKCLDAALESLSSSPSTNE